MGRRDKGLVDVHGAPMVAHVANALRPYTRRLFINCNASEALYAPFCDETVPDVYQGHLGPLAGLHALLNVSTADFLLTSSCDTPCLSSHFAEEMLRTLATSHSPGASPNDYDLLVAKTHRIQPMHALIRVSRVRDAIEHALQHRQLKVMQWMKTLNVQFVDFADAHLFDNINSEEDLKTLQC